MTVVPSSFCLKIIATAVFSVFALVTTDVWAEASCGKEGFADTPVAEQEFAKRLIEVVYLHYLVPTEQWATNFSSRRAGGYFENNLGATKVCKRAIGGIRSTGTENVGYGKVITAANWTARNVVTQECNLRRTEVNKLPPDKQAQYDDMNQQRTELTRQVREARRANQHALADEKYKESEKLGQPMQTIINEHDRSIQIQLSNLYRECKAKEDAIFESGSYSIRLVVNGAASFKPFQNEFIVHDIGDRSLRAGPSDKLRRVTLAASPLSSRKSLDPQEMALIKSWIDWNRLQALLDKGGSLPSDAEIQSLKDTQQAALKVQDDWIKQQEQQQAQSERDRRQQNNQAANPSATPAPSKAPVPTSAQAANSPAPAPSTSQAPAPAPAPTLPNLPQIPSNVGNVLRGVFGR